ncbi:MAG TPA: GatB/YqeY domain-containing protein [Candidatus Sulfotelmatobacter sp.]|nr:GatB/YqeY domain-containing protein [Candidatus Sulfotelmatobacter sp.]
MSLNERLTEDMKAAMKAGPTGKVRLDTIRFLRAALKYVEIDKKAPLTDEDILGVITKQVKQLKDSIDEFEKGGRADLIDKAKAEIEVLSGYLPQQMSEAEVRDLARQIVAEVGAQGPKDMGKVMGPLVARTKGRADGKLVQQVVKELLG